MLNKLGVAVHDGKLISHWREFAILYTIQEGAAPIVAGRGFIDQANSFSTIYVHSSSKIGSSTEYEIASFSARDLTPVSFQYSLLQLIGD